MHYRDIYRRVLIAAMIIWSVVPCYWAIRALPSSLEEQRVQQDLARDYLVGHPMTEIERADILAAAQQMAPKEPGKTSGTDSGGMLFGGDQIASAITAEELVENIAQRVVLNRDRSLRARAWFQARERSGIILLRFMVIPVIAVMVFYRVSLLFARWIATGNPEHS